MNLKKLVHNTFNIVTYIAVALMVFPVYEIGLVVIESSSNGFIFIDNVELSNRFFFNGVMPFLALTYTFFIASFITLKTN
jgi:hypothetical protein